MTRPGFRKGRTGGSGGAAASDADAFLGTALFSQAQILHLMKTEFARSRRYGHPVGCLLIAVDRLAQLVDLHGGALRTELRSAIGKMVRERTRGADLLGVLAEDRYLLVLPHTSLAQTRIVAERLHQLFAGLEVAVDGRVLAPTASIGFTASGDAETMFFDTIVAQAEAALEWSERRGGNAVVSFGETQLRAPDGGGEA
ncbi:MAG: GGDEF domain-containing protein [Planctomycetes bacterium]|nr:GGDEF domain-containing protein [Planctomycetota bacterium]